MLKTHNNKLSPFINKYGDLFSVAVIFIFALTVLRSAFYGISSPDESFYLSIPYRLILGDSLLVDEWHASQLSAFLLYLPMKVYLSVTGSTDGIMLYFRCIFVFCQTAVSLFTYHKLKKHGSLAALVSAVIYLLYVPETVNMLDYYTMSLMGFQVLALILFCSEKLNPPTLVFAGIVFACVVIAQPFNCLIYFIYSVCVFFLCIRIKKKPLSETSRKYFSIKSWLSLTVGIVITAAVFLAFLFSQISLNDLMANIGNLFGGHDHTLPFAQTGKTDMFSYLTIISTILRIAPVGFYIILILFFSLAYDKKRHQRRNLWILASFCCVLFLTIECIVSSFNDFTAILFKPYILFVLTYASLMLTKNKDKHLWFIWWSGIVYTIFLGIISQALDYVGVIGFVISNTALAPSITMLYKEISVSQTDKESEDKKNSKPLIVKILCFISAAIISFDVISGTAIKFIDDTMAYGTGREIIAVDTVIDKGPLKGIRTNASVDESYRNILDDLDEIKEKTNGKVLVAGLIPWTYFCFDKSPAAFTTWYIEEEFDLYQEYYKDENHLPDAIYVPKINLYWGYNYTEISEKHKEFFSAMFDTTQADGKAGYILYVNF